MNQYNRQLFAEKVLLRDYSESYLDAVACLSPFCNPPLLPPAGDTATLVLFDDDPPTLLQLGAKASAVCAATFTFGPPSASLKAAARVKKLEQDCRVALCLFVSCVVVIVLVPSVKTKIGKSWIWNFMKKVCRINKFRCPCNARFLVQKCILR